MIDKKKPSVLEDPLGAFGEFLTDPLGPVFDYFEGKNKPAVETKEVAPNGNGNGNAESGKPAVADKRGTGSTFTASTPAKPAKGKGASVDSGNGAKGGDDGDGVPAETGDEPKK